MKPWGVVVGVVLMLAGVMFAWPVSAGDLNPPGPPAPTMKTQDQIPPTWDQILPAGERFKLVMGSVAVLDKETGLVWDKSPDTLPRSWLDGLGYCFTKLLGGRKGWRLPTIEELASLVDSTVIGPALPPGHPFTNVQVAYYWSATTSAANSGFAWYVNLNDGHVGALDKTGTDLVWCVRGGRGVDGQ